MYIIPFPTKKKNTSKLLINKLIIMPVSTRSRSKTKKKRKRINNNSSLNNTNTPIKVALPKSKKSKNKKNTKKKKKNSKGRMIKAAVKAIVGNGSSSSSSISDRGQLLFDLGRDLISATMICRPSKRNRSPYVADITLNEDGNRTAIAHVPNLDMGGKCVKSTEMLLTAARDRKGNLVGANTLGKYGTPKCEFHAKLIKVKEAENSTLNDGNGVFVGAHPSLGEKIAKSLLEKNLIKELPPIVDISTQVSNICNCDMRTDFVVTHEDGTRNVIEVKQVVDTDYNSETPPPNREKCVFFEKEKPYIRSGIFPWGNSKQKGPDGEKVVSARAIKHVRELTKIARGTVKDNEGKKLNATILFINNREDALQFRPNSDACPSFARYLKEAKDGGVNILCRRVIWGNDGDDIGKAFDGGNVDVKFFSSC